MNLEEFLSPELIELYVIPWTIRIVMALVVFIIGRWIAKLVVRMTGKMMNRAQMDNMLTVFLGNGVHLSVIGAEVDPVFMGEGNGVDGPLSLVHPAHVAAFDVQGVEIAVGGSEENGVSHHNGVVEGIGGFGLETQLPLDCQGGSQPVGSSPLPLFPPEHDPVSVLSAGAQEKKHQQEAEEASSLHPQ